jgi:hypothetical protein
MVVDMVVDMVVEKNESFRKSMKINIHILISIALHALCIIFLFVGTLMNVCDKVEYTYTLEGLPAEVPVDVNVTKSLAVNIPIMSIGGIILIPLAIIYCFTIHCGSPIRIPLYLQDAHKQSCAVAVYLLIFYLVGAYTSQIRLSFPGWRVAESRCIVPVLTYTTGTASSNGTLANGTLGNATLANTTTYYTVDERFPSGWKGISYSCSAPPSLPENYKSQIDTIKSTQFLHLKWFDILAILSGCVVFLFPCILQLVDKIPKYYVTRRQPDRLEYSTYPIYKSMDQVNDWKLESATTSGGMVSSPDGQNMYYNGNWWYTPPTRGATVHVDERF